MNKKPTDSQRMRVNDFFWIVDLLSMFGIGKIEQKKNNRQHRFVVHSREFRHRLEIKSIEIISYLVEWTQRGKYTLIKIKCKYAFKMALCLYGGGQQFGTTLDFSCVSFNFLMTFFQSYFQFRTVCIFSAMTSNCSPIQSSSIFSNGNSLYRTVGKMRHYKLVENFNRASSVHSASYGMMITFCFDATKRIGKRMVH